MKRNPNFLLREVAGKLVLVPVGEAARSFPGMVTMNATGKFLWELLENEQTVESVVAAMTSRYDVSEESATADVQTYLTRLKAVGAVSE